LIDFYDFCGKSYDPFTPRKITAEEIKACAKAQGVEFKYGDIFIVRTGFSEAYRKLNKQQREAMSATAYLELKFAGLSRAHDMVELLHDNYFSAVASDAPSFETWPMDEPEHLHHWLLPLWGSPIGELWDLEELAALCKKHKRYTFFLSSSPANVKGKDEHLLSTGMKTPNTGSRRSG
jgi:kynurenine formamidase